MKNHILTTLLILLTLINASNAQDDVDLFNYWKYYSDAENSLYKHFCAEAFVQLDARNVEISMLKTKAEWQERQAIVAKKFTEIVGAFPEKTPLNTQITGVLNRDGYRIEKLIYESIPGYYITGAIYIPDGITEKAPAIFYACGHSLEGFRVGVYQNIIINLVKKGFVVFTIDPMGQGERYEYWDISKDEPRYRIPDHEHSYAGAQCLISGYSTGRYFIWDAIRGIDYMLTRKEIDPQRIGMTGRSGGGNITAYVGALDNRILATAPECYITSYRYILNSIGPQCAEQNLYQMVSEGLDHADFIEARAPKPTMIIGTTRDFFSIQGGRESYKEAKKIYVAMGAGENLSMVEDDNKHTSTKKNREAMYAFFQEQLDNPGNSEDVEVEVPSPQELQVTKTGQVVSSYKAKSVFSMTTEIVDRQIKKRESLHTDINKYLGKLPSVVAEISGFEYPEKYAKSIFSGRFVNPEYILEKYLIEGSGDYVLPMVLLKPNGLQKNKVVLMMDSEGMEHAVNQDSLAHKLVGEGYAVLIFDLPGIGSMGPGYMKGDSYIDGVSYNQWFAAVLVGKSNVALRAEDVTRVVDFAKNELVEFESISALSIGPLGGELLHAATFNPYIKSVCIISPFLGYADVATTRFYKPEYIPFIVAGAIEEYDLADLIAGLCPRKVVVINPNSGDGTAADKGKITDCYLFPIEVYSEKGVSGNFTFKNSVDDNEIVNHIFLCTSIRKS